MSTREIIAELPHLTIAELQAVEQRIIELTSRQAFGPGHVPEVGTGLRAERFDGRLILAGSRTIRQAEVTAILDEFPLGGVREPREQRHSNSSGRAKSLRIRPHEWLLHDLSFQR